MTVKIITKPLLWWSDYHYSYTAYYIQCKRRDRYFIIMSSIIQMRTLSNCHYLMCNYEQRCYLTTNKELAIFKMILYRLQGLLYHTRHASFHHNALQHNPWTWRTWQIHFHRVTCFAFPTSRRSTTTYRFYVVQLFTTTFLPLYMMHYCHYVA